MSKGLLPTGNSLAGSSRAVSICAHAREPALATHASHGHSASSHSYYIKYFDFGSPIDAIRRSCFLDYMTNICALIGAGTALAV